jgi:hypothetical protein
MTKRLPSPAPALWKTLSVSIRCRAGPTRLEQAYRLLLRPPDDPRAAEAAIRGTR